MGRNRAKKRMTKLQEIQDFCEETYGEQITLAKPKKRSTVVCEKCGADMGLLQDFGTHKIYICTEISCTARVRK